MNKKTNGTKKKYMYCIQCGANPIIKIDNAKQYICSKCMPKNYDKLLKIVRRRSE